jgi:hypothetical protein
MGAMLEMMQRMMGQGEGEGEGEGEGQGEGESEQGGEGQTGDSDAANSEGGGANEGNKEERRVPKSSGTAGTNLPEEFRKALDAYNSPPKKTTE